MHQDKLKSDGHNRADDDLLTQQLAPRRANLENGDHEGISLIVGMLEVLRPYFDCTSDKTPREKDLVRILYGPFYRALERMERGHFDA